MRRLIFLLVLALAAAVIEGKEKATKDVDYGYYDDEDESEAPKEDKFNIHIAKWKKEIRDKIQKNKGEIKDDNETAEKEEKEEEKPNGKQGRGRKDKEYDSPTLICDGTPEEACKCELKEVNCVNIFFDDGSVLDSLDVQIDKTNKKLENFKPTQARFADNVITKLERNRMPEGMEETLNGLYLERNKISRIEEGAFDGFKNISKLVLEGNRLRTIKSEWWTGDIGKTLHVLNLANNKIRQTEKSPFKNLKNLKKLVLDDNALVLDKDFFEGLDKLEILSMDDCDFDDKSLPEGIFKPLKNLNKLSLRENAFTEVPAALEEISHLGFLDLSETNIAELHQQSFVDEPEMQTIFFEQMPYLTSVQECAFCGLKKLKQLSFNNCSRLTTIDANAFGFYEHTDDRTVELIDLRLAKTNVSQLSLNLLEYGEMERLDLDRAPINCTCEMMFLKNVKFAGGTSTGARCAYPISIKGKYIEQTQIKEVCGYRYARGYRFFFALCGVISASVFVTVGYILFNKGYRLTNIRHLPLPTLPGQNSAYTNLSRQEENELTGIVDAQAAEADATPDFEPRPQMV